MNEEWKREMREAASVSIEARKSARRVLSRMLDNPDASNADKLRAAELLSKLRPARAVSFTSKGPKNKPRADVEPSVKREALTEADIAEMRAALRHEPGCELFAQRHGDHKFIEEFKSRAQSSLYFFAKYVLAMRDLTPRLHKEVADFIQDQSECRKKLLMLPVNHLKTSIGSQAFPLHVLVQPQERNLYLARLEGRDVRILLAGETADKVKEDLDFIKRHLMENRWLRALWPEMCWEDPRKQSSRWKDDAIEVKRSRIKPEPSITAIGVGGALHKRHYEIIVMDDLATFKASQSQLVMEATRQWRKAIRSRLHDPSTSIELGIGTHWGPQDIYVDWKEEVGVQKLVMSILEDGEPIWPERFSAAVIDELRRTTDPILFSLNYMNIPVSASTTMLDWATLREFVIANKHVVFADDPRDTLLAERILGPGKFEQVRVTAGMTMAELYRAQPREVKPLAPGDAGWDQAAHLRAKYGTRDRALGLEK